MPSQALSLYSQYDFFPGTLDSAYHGITPLDSAGPSTILTGNIGLTHTLDNVAGHMGVTLSGASPSRYITDASISFTGTLTPKTGGAVSEGGGGASTGERWE